MNASPPLASGAVNFAIPGELSELAGRIDAFVRSQVIPFEKDPGWTSHGPTNELRRELNGLAREAGLLGLASPKEFGGHGLSHVGKAVALSAAGYSMLGPIATHCAAPDEGNIHMLNVIASPAHRQQFLGPLARAEVRSCFCMSEPPPGAGADPAQLQTTAREDGDGFIIDGRKWLITGADGAGFAIIMAKMAGTAADGRATMFLSPMDAKGIVVERLLDTMDTGFTGGHAVMRFEGLRVGRDAVLGEIGEGFRYAQVRLAPARLTHCMRWLGSAQRAHDIAAEYARTRTAFGSVLGRHEGVSFMLADNLMDMHVVRLTILHTAWLLDQGKHASRESSMAKVICSEAISRVVDRSLQILGGLGMTRETVVERIYRDVRAFRIYDGPSEVHRWAIGRRIVEESKT